MNRAKMTPARRAWNLLAEPRTLTFIFCIVYLLMIIQGAISFFTPALDVPQTVPRVMVDVLLIVGGALGLVATPRGLWLFEKPAIFMICGAHAVHLLWVVGDFDGDGRIGWQRAISIFAIVLFMIARWAKINPAMLDPAKP